MIARRLLTLSLMIGAILGASILPAQAITESGHLKEAFGAGYYMGTPSLSYGQVVREEFGGRQMEFDPTGGSWCDGGGHCYTKGVLRLSNGSNTCAGAPSAPNDPTVVGEQWSSKTGQL